MTGKPHDETSMDCWCEPFIEHKCPACEGEGCERSDLTRCRMGPCKLCGGDGWKECRVPLMCGRGGHVINRRYPRGTPGACYFLKEPDDAV